MESSVKLEIVKDQVGLVTFDQANSRANSLNTAVLAEFQKLLSQIAARSDLRGLILRSGKPGMFIAGADLKELGGCPARPGPAPQRFASAASTSSPPSRRCLTRPWPPSTAPAWAAAWNWPWASTIRLAGTHPKTEIGLPEVEDRPHPRLGRHAAADAAHRPVPGRRADLRRRTGQGRRARELGIVFDAVPRERLLDEACRLLQWAQQSGSWQEARQRKQQPVGLSEEQTGLHVRRRPGPRCWPRPRANSRPRWPPSTPSPRAATCRSTRASRSRPSAFVPLVGSPDLAQPRSPCSS